MHSFDIYLFIFLGAPGRQQPLRTHKIDEIIITNIAVILKLLNLRPAASMINLNLRVLHMYFEFIMDSMVNHTHTTWTSAKRDRVGYLARWFNVPARCAVLGPATRMFCTQHNYRMFVTRC